eukprot:g18320.t1
MVDFNEQMVDYNEIPMEKISDEIFKVICLSLAIQCRLFFQLFFPSSLAAWQAEDDKAQTAITAVNEEKAPATTAGEANMPAAFNLEVIVGKNKVGELRILLPFGVDSDIEQRLSACVAPDGGSVDFIVGQTVCGFGGHAVPGQKETDKGPEEGLEQTRFLSSAACRMHELL